jgi:hypothetical protein
MCISFTRSVIVAVTLFVNRCADIYYLMEKLLAYVYVDRNDFSAKLQYGVTFISKNDYKQAQSQPLVNNIFNVPVQMSNLQDSYFNHSPFSHILDYFLLVYFR